MCCIFEVQSLLIIAAQRHLDSKGDIRIMSRSIEALREAINTSDLATVKRLVKDDPELLTAIVHPGTNRNYRPITEAAVECQLEILTFLIASGGDVAEDGNYALKRASLYDRCIPAIEMLVEHGADVNSPDVLIAACEGKALACMKWLLEHGAQITGSAEAPRGMVDWNAFTHAAHFNRQCPGMLALLLEYGAKVDDVHPDLGNTLGSTALHNAARQGDVPGVTLLLEHGAIHKSKLRHVTYASHSTSVNTVPPATAHSATPVRGHINVMRKTAFYLQSISQIRSEPGACTR